MGFGDVGDDGQAETESVRAGGPVRGGALEGLEQSADLVWRYGGPGVGHGERRFCDAGCVIPSVFNRGVARVVAGAVASAA